MKFVLNGQQTLAAGLTSFPASGFTASSGNRIQSWIIETRPIDLVTHISLTESDNVRGPIRYRIYDSFDTMTEVIGPDIGAFVPVMVERVERIVISTDQMTLDGRPPRNLKLSVNGCSRENIISTKAQIESTTTTTSISGSSENLISLLTTYKTFFHLVFCLENRVDTLKNPSMWFDNVTINNKSLIDSGILSAFQFATGTGGVTFDQRNPFPTIDIIPKESRGSFAVLGFNNNPNRPNNIQSAEVKLEFKEGTKKIYSLIGPSGLFATIQPNYDVSKLTYQILKTTDGQPARNVELMAMACGKGKLVSLCIAGIIFSNILGNNTQVIINTTPGM